jgi:NAD-dependent deacetylase
VTKPDNLISAELKDRLQDIARSSSRITVLTGAGISAESGIPTFRGPEGYWTVGSKEYHPQEMATYRMFGEKPYEVWEWYLYRLGICAAAEPNPGHLAVAAMEKALQGRFTLITQNVDNLHLQAGNSLENTFQIHGNIFYARCQATCGYGIQPLPAGLKAKKKGEDLSKEERSLLACPRCGSNLRPHVLWFDETYDEVHYRFQSSLVVASQTELLLTVGTSGATNLPNQVAWGVYQKGGTIIDINIERNPFSELAERSRCGAFIQGMSSSVLPDISRALLEQKKDIQQSTDH